MMKCLSLMKRMRMKKFLQSQLAREVEEDKQLRKSQVLRKSLREAVRSNQKMMRTRRRRFQMYQSRKGNKLM